jgi:uncharacterized membrane protein (DUF485 family)
MAKSIMKEDVLNIVLSTAFTICKWSALQIFLYFIMPYLWNYEYSLEAVVSISLYTSLYVTYWKFCLKELRFKWVVWLYIIYIIVSIALSYSVNAWKASLWFSILLPLYGLACSIGYRFLHRYIKGFFKTNKYGKTIVYSVAILFIVVLKIFSVLYVCQEHKSLQTETDDILERKNYLVEKLVTSPQNVLAEMPSSIGEQFQGEWALYSCSMLSAALVNISYLYPDTKEENILYIDSLINIVISKEIRHYDAMRWNEDALESLRGRNSHVSYLSHLAWMICGYKELGGCDKYDDLLSDLCESMNRRILNSENLNLPTYPGEAIYVPDMLVAIVALNKYADMNDNKYRSTVDKWIATAKEEWLDSTTGLLVSFLNENGKMYKNSPIKGSYSALNCYYLTFIDEEFAQSQYEKLKVLFWKDSFLSGLKEYWNIKCYIGIDIDAGPILFELSPSGTAFLTGSSTFFGDFEVRKDILKTAETAAHTVKFGDKRHYLLADIALVGESIMLAMRTHAKH